MQQGGEGFLAGRDDGVAHQCLIVENVVGATVQLEDAVAADGGMLHLYHLPWLRRG